MNQTFDLRRFGLILKLQVSEHLKTYMMGIGVLAGAWALLLAPTMTSLTHYNPATYSFHAGLFSLLFTTAGAWLASQSLRSVSTPLKGIPYLALPASMLEKFLASFVVLLLFVPVGVAVFYLIEGSCFSFINARLPAGEPRYELLDLTGPYLSPDLRFFLLLVPSFFLMGSIYFPKTPFIRTGIIAFALFFALRLLNDYLVSKGFPPRSLYGNTPFLEVRFWEKGRWYNLELQGTSKLLIYDFLLLSAPLMWVIAYVRLKEKEL